MSNETDEKSEPTAPRPGRGFTVVELRTAHQTDIVKSAVKGLKTENRYEDRWVVVKNTEAQAVIDKVIAAYGNVGIFDRRVLDYFVAVVLLANEKLTDSRTSLHARLIVVGRATKDFRFEMKQDGTLTVHVGRKFYPTQKAAMEALAPDQLKSPTSAASPRERRDAKAERAKANVERLAAAKAESKALRAWEATPEAERGERPATPNLDAEHAAYEAKQAQRKAS